MKIFKRWSCKHKYKLVKVVRVTEILFSVIRYNRLEYKCNLCGKKKKRNDFAENAHSKMYHNLDIKEYVKEESKKRDLDRKKNKEVWHYTCENGHEWKSYSSPRGTFVYGEEGQTRCSECKSTVTMGEVYINGKKTQMGAMHMAFRTKGKRRKDIFSQLSKDLIEAKGRHSI